MTRFKYSKKLVLSFCLFGLLGGSPSQASDSPVLTLSGGTTTSRPPYRWIDKCTGKLTGSVPHLVGKIFSQLDIPYEYAAPLPFNENLVDLFNSRLQAGGLDARIVFSESAKVEGVLYSTFPVSSLKMAAFYPATNEVISSIEQLKTLQGVVVSFAARETSLSPLQAYLTQRGYPFIVVGTQNDAMAALRKNKADYRLGLKYGRQLFDKEYRYLEVPDTGGEFILALSEKSPFVEKMPAIERLLDEAAADGLMDFLDKKYMMLAIQDKDKACPM